MNEGAAIPGAGVGVGRAADARAGVVLGVVLGVAAAVAHAAVVGDSSASSIASSSPFVSEPCHSSKLAVSASEGPSRRAASSATAMSRLFSSL